MILWRLATLVAVFSIMMTAFNIGWVYGNDRYQQVKMMERSAPIYIRDDFKREHGK